MSWNKVQWIPNLFIYVFQLVWNILLEMLFFNERYYESVMGWFCGFSNTLQSVKCLYKLQFISEKYETTWVWKIFKLATFFCKIDYF